VRDAIKKAKAAWSNALGHAMDAGDALNRVQPLIAERGINWKKWLRDNCFVAVSTALLYQQLARHRDVIEAQLQQGVELSLRAARKLISGPGEGISGSESSATSAEEDTILARWRRAPADERMTFLDRVGVDAFLAAMSPAFACALQARVPGGKPGKRPTLNLVANNKLAAQHINQMRE
jgi:hypothetical protein